MTPEATRKVTQPPPGCFREQRNIVPRRRRTRGLTPFFQDPAEKGPVVIKKIQPPGRAYRRGHTGNIRLTPGQAPFAIAVVHHKAPHMHHAPRPGLEAQLPHHGPTHKDNASIFTTGIILQTLKTNPCTATCAPSSHLLRAFATIFCNYLKLSI